MKTCFLPQLQRTWVAAAIGGVSLITGGIQAISGHSKEKKAEKAIENLQTPTYKSNSSILDYYQKALQRYNTNPYQSQQYQTGIQQGNRTTAAGINALQDRRSAVGGISRLAALQNNNALNSGIAAENEQNQRFGQLGSATQLKSSDDQYGFQINQIMPYQKQLQLLGLKAGGGAQMENAGLQTINNGLNSAAMIGYSNSSNGNNNAPYMNYSGTGSNSGVNLNALTGGVSGNQNVLNSGNPFSQSIFDYQNPYGE